MSSLDVAGRDTAVTATVGGLPVLRPGLPALAPDVRTAIALLHQPDRVFTEGMQLAREAHVGAFRMRVGYDRWTVLVDPAWQQQSAQWGPAQVDPFEFRLRMPTLNVPGGQVPRGIVESTRLSRESLARRCSARAVAERSGALLQVIDRHLEQADAQAGVLDDGFAWMLRCCVDLISAMLLGPELAQRLPPGFADDYLAVERSLSLVALIAPRLPSLRARRARAVKRRIAGIWLELVRQRRSGELPGGDDLLQDLLDGGLAARGETQHDASLGLSAEGGVAETRSTPSTTSFRLPPLDENPGARRRAGFHHGLLELADAELAWMLNSIHWAAHRYPAVHAFWIGVLLHARPQLLARILDEQAGIAELDDEGLARMPLLRGCVLESLRMHPVMCLPRRLLQSVEVGGHRLAAGEVVALSPYAAHHNPALLERPHEFLPERWCDETRPVPRGAFMPGGLGRWSCVGMRLTVHMLMLLWARILRSHTLALPSTPPEFRYGTIISPPRTAVAMHLQPRARP